jgi:hypothetical protein
VDARPVGSRLRILHRHFRDGFSHDTSSIGDHTAAMNSRRGPPLLICVKAVKKAGEFSLVALKNVSAFAPS